MMSLGGMFSKLSRRVRPESAEAHVNRLLQALQDQDYKQMSIKYASGAFATSLAFCEGMAMGNYMDYGKELSKDPPTFFVIGHYVKGGGKDLSNHFVVAAEASAEDILEDRGCLFPKFIRLKDFNDGLSGRDIKAFFDAMPRATQETYAVFRPKGVEAG